MKCICVKEELNQNKTTKKQKQKNKQPTAPMISKNTQRDRVSE